MTLHTDNQRAWAGGLVGAAVGVTVAVVLPWGAWYVAAVMAVPLAAVCAAVGIEVALAIGDWRDLR